MNNLFVFNWIALPQLLIGIFLLVQGLIVLIQNPRSSLHRAFFFFQLSPFIWLVGMGIAYSLTSIHYAFIFAVIGSLGAMWIPITIYSFSVYYSGNLKQRKIILLGLLPTILLTFFLWDPLFSLGIFEYSWGYYIKVGPLGYPLLALFMIFTPYFVFNLYSRYKRSAPEQKNWCFLVFLAGAIACLSIIDFLPAFGFAFFFPPFGYLFVGIFATLIGYFILRHHLADIKIIAGRTISYIALTVLLFFIYTSFFILFFPGSLTLREIIFNAFFFIACLYVLSLFKRKTQNLVDNVFFKEKINYENLVARFNTQLRDLRDLASLTKALSAFLTNSLHVQSSTILIFQQKEMRWYIYESSSSDFSKPKKENVSLFDEFISFMINNPKVIDAREFIYRFQIPESAGLYIIKLIQRFKGQLVIPLVRYNSFLGFVIVGKKFSGEDYSKKEILALQNLATPFCIAWDNARLYEDIQEMSKTKSEFVSIVSHQLRTPLSHFKWSFNMLIREDLGKLAKKQKKFLGNVYINIENMINLVTRLLDVLAIEEGVIKTNLTKVSLSPLIKEVLYEKVPLMKEKNIAFRSYVSSKLPLVIANREYLKAILFILFDNAIKYTKPKGVITFTIKKTKPEKLLFIIEDTGIGIPADEQKNIFSKFFRARNAIKFRPTGTGLGLFYAKMIVEKQKGKIWLKSEEGKGTKFYVTLPLAKEI